MKFEYGITTTPERMDLFTKTLQSIITSGFYKPRLFLDGGSPADYSGFDLEITHHSTPVGPYGNWLLALVELYTRNPRADRYILFQDDLVCVRNLREHLSTPALPKKAYFNLYTVPANEAMSRGQKGWFLANQLGKGALALMFTLEGINAILRQPSLFNRVLDPHRGWKFIDGAVVYAMHRAGFREYCHSPSLVQHLGNGRTTLGSKERPVSNSFPGEEFDILTLKPTVKL